MLDHHVPQFVLSKSPDFVQTVVLEHVDTVDLLANAHNSAADDVEEEEEEHCCYIEWLTRIHNLVVMSSNTGSLQIKADESKDLNQWRIYVLPRIPDEGCSSAQSCVQTVMSTIERWKQQLSGGAAEEDLDRDTLLDAIDSMVLEIDASWDINRAAAVLRSGAVSSRINGAANSLLQSNAEFKKAFDIIDKINERLSQRIASSIYNGRMYFLNQIDPFITPDCPMQQQQQQTFVEFYRQRYGIEIEDHEQPLMKATFLEAADGQRKKKYWRKKGVSPLLKELQWRMEQKDQDKNISLMKSDSCKNTNHAAYCEQHVHLIPELCRNIDAMNHGLGGLTDKQLNKILLHVGEALDHYRKMLNFQEKVGISISDMLLLRKAFTHPAYAQEIEYPPRSNQQLEFMGDSVVHLAATRFVYHTFTQVHRYDMDWSYIATHLVGNRFLQRVEPKVGLLEHVLYSQPRETLLLQKKLVADVWESLLGSIMTDSGFEAAALLHERICLDKPLIALSSSIKKHVKSIEEFPPDDTLPDVDDGYLNLLDSLEDKIGVSFGDNKVLLQRAMCHWSWEPSKGRIITDEELNRLRRMNFFDYDRYEDEKEETNLTGSYYCFNNESLKFLGLALLKPIINEHLFFTFAGATEEQLTLCSHAIFDKNDVCMIHAFEELELERYVFPRTLLEGKIATHQHRILSEALFALVGAIFIQSGHILHKFDKTQPKLDSPAAAPKNGEEGEDWFFAQQNGIYHDIAGSFVHRFILSKFDQTPALHPHNIEKPRKSRVVHTAQRLWGSSPKFEFEKLTTSDGGDGPGSVVYRVTIRVSQVRQGHPEQFAQMSTAEAPTHRSAEKAAIDIALAQYEDQLEIPPLAGTPPAVVQTSHLKG